jgi:hypothetical protein
MAKKRTRVEADSEVLKPVEIEAKEAREAETTTTASKSTRSSKFAPVVAPCAIESVPEDSEVFILRVPSSFDWSRLNGARLPESLLRGAQESAKVHLSGVGGSVTVTAAAASTQCLRVGAVRKKTEDDDSDDSDGAEKAEFEVLGVKPTALLTLSSTALSAGSFLKPVKLTSREAVTDWAIPVQVEVAAGVAASGVKDRKSRK